MGVIQDGDDEPTIFFSWMLINRMKVILDGDNDLAIFFDQVLINWMGVTWMGVI